jgi:DNA-directed RNA polymerase specialized sigma24 family protein
MSVDLDVHAAAIGAGDLEAFGRWVAGAEPVVRGSLRPFAARVDAEAVVQETLFRVWQVAGRFLADGRPNGLLRLALRIARNQALDEMRRLRTMPADPATLARLADDPAGAVQPVEPDPGLRQAIEDCRRKLPPRPAAAIAARVDGDGVTPDRMLAAALGMRLNTFLQNVSRARKLLLDCLETRGVRVMEELR